jgi:hypothetical protein
LCVLSFSAGITALTDAISGNGALTKFDISTNKLYAAGAKALADGLKGNQVMTELNLAGNELGKAPGGLFGVKDMSGIIALADIIPGMGALSTTNVMGNNIGKEMLSKLQEIMHSKPNLVSLCGIADDATEADLSGLGMDADDAIILASELPDKGALYQLILKDNRLATAEAGEALGEALKCNTVLKELDVSGNKGDGPGFAKGISKGLSGNEALTSLNLSSNDIGAHWDNAQGKMVVTPEGTFICGCSRLLFSRCILCRPSCYC